ncbi:glucan endo-1,3-beta-glucosidase 8-like [Salvia miltiorrhiza]|uniref:glucan endo-1,3-beta-glucosidase 8-like n=1 Tax=Salvia miltiorrhiza TaxID=226208 RepID=UPI0025ABF713|nr:glucan endo-1,3-beta-glucosidase 8-like [Salvia miltiorrhiza]
MASTMTIVCALMVVGQLAGYGAGAFIGMTWGRQSAQRLLPSQVVDLLLQNGVTHLRIFSTQEDILRAFAGSNIDLTITIFDPLLPDFNDARSWFQLKAHFIVPANVSTVIVGGDYVFDKPLWFIDRAMKTLRDAQAAFNEFGYGARMKANFIHNSGELTNRTRPSDVEFRPCIVERMIQHLQFLRENDAPFMLDLFPIDDARRCGLDLSFGFADNASNVIVRDRNGAVYKNVVEWEYDCFVWALRKLNFSDIRILISQVGWPTDGCVGATAHNAERFYRYLLPLVASNRGTPMRPGVAISVYVHALTDEPKMSYNNPWMRHWGIYTSNGQPKYKIDLSGKGRDIYPSTVRGIMRMPDRWCVFSGDKSDMGKVEKQVKKACTIGDCTTLSPGASCSHLTVDNNISYAFNVFFQSHFQDERSCDFEGLGYVSDDDPSTDHCVFPVEVVKGQQLINFI